MTSLPYVFDLDYQHVEKYSDVFPTGMTDAENARFDAWMRWPALYLQGRATAKDSAATLSPEDARKVAAYHYNLEEERSRVATALEDAKGFHEVMHMSIQELSSEVPALRTLHRLEELAERANRVARGAVNLFWRRKLDMALIFSPSRREGVISLMQSTRPEDDKRRASVLAVGIARFPKAFSLDGAKNSDSTINQIRMARQYIARTCCGVHAVEYGITANAVTTAVCERWLFESAR